MSSLALIYQEKVYHMARKDKENSEHFPHENLKESIRTLVLSDFFSQIFLIFYIT